MSILCLLKFSRFRYTRRSISFSSISHKVAELASSDACRTRLSSPSDEGTVRTNSGAKLGNNCELAKKNVKKMIISMRNRKNRKKIKRKYRNNF